MKPLKILIVSAALVGLAASAGAAPTSVWLTSVTHTCETATDDTIRVDVMLNSTNDPVDLAGVGVSYYDDVLHFVRAERGTLIAGWPTFTVNDVLTGPGLTHQINIDAGSPTPIPVGVSGQFARLVFVTTGCEQPDHLYNLTLCFAQLWDDFQGIESSCGSIRINNPAAGLLSIGMAYQNCVSALGDTVEVDVRFDDLVDPVDAAGLDIIYNPAQLEYVGYKKGDLTASWTFFDAAKVLDRIRVGGFTQSQVPASSGGVFVTLRFLVHCCENGFIEWMTPAALVDDIAGMTKQSGFVSCVALKTKQSSWGYIKTLYR
jgi:hypothetical protein